MIDVTLPALNPAVAATAVAMVGAGGLERRLGPHSRATAVRRRSLRRRSPPRPDRLPPARSAGGARVQDCCLCNRSH
jgi:hypothetical protein